MTESLTLPVLIVATLLLGLTTCRTSTQEAAVRSAAKNSSNCGLTLSKPEALEIGGYTLLRPGTDSYDLFMKADSVENLASVFLCPDQAAAALQSKKDVMVYVGDDIGSNASAENRDKLLTWLFREHPGGLLLEIMADCQTAIKGNDSRCLQRVKHRSDFASMLLFKDERHDQAPSKNSYTILKPHIANFETKFNQQLHLQYPLLFADDVAKKEDMVNRPWRYEERYLLDTEQGIETTKHLLKLWSGFQTSGQRIVFVGLGQGAEIFSEAVLEAAQEKTTLAKNASLDLLNLPGWAALNHSEKPELGLPYAVINQAADLRVQSANFFRYFAYRQLFGEHLASAEVLPDAYFQKAWLQENISQLETSVEQRLTLSDRSLTYRDEFQSGSADSSALTLMLPYQSDLRGRLAFELNIKDLKSSDGQIYPLFQYGDCNEKEDARELLPYAWLEKKNHRLQLNFAIRYQSEEHLLSSFALTTDDAWQKLQFNWQLPVKSVLPEMVSVIDLATFFDRAPKAKNSKYLQILAWIMSEQLPSSYAIQQGNGNMEMLLNDKEVASVEMKPEKGGRYFRGCLSPNDRQGANNGVFTDYSGLVDWDLASGSVCKAIMPRKNLPLNFACNPAAPGLRIRNIKVD